MIKNELIDFVEKNMPRERILFNKKSSDKRIKRCIDFKIIPIKNYDSMVNDCILYFRNKGYVVSDLGNIIEIFRL